MAVDRVEKRLRKVTAALDAAGVKYAVIGGNAVAAWVARVDPSATRSTVDVDLMTDRRDSDRVDIVMEALGFTRHDVSPTVLFTDPDEPSRRSGVHVVWAGERIRPSYCCPAPLIDEAVRDPQGFCVLDLPALVRMKLTSFRLIDRVHMEDLLKMKLIDDPIRRQLPDELRQRLDEVERTFEDDLMEF